jgi:hypothetical protein
MTGVDGHDPSDPAAVGDDRIGADHRETEDGARAAAQDEVRREVQHGGADVISAATCQVDLARPSVTHDLVTALEGEGIACADHRDPCGDRDHIRRGDRQDGYPSPTDRGERCPQAKRSASRVYLVPSHNDRSAARGSATTREIVSKSMVAL